MIVDELVIALKFGNSARVAKDLKSLESQMDAVRDSTKGATTQLKQAEKALKDADKQVAAAEKELKRLEAAYKKTGDATDKLAVETQRNLVMSLRTAATSQRAFTEQQRAAVAALRDQQVELGRTSKKLRENAREAQQRMARLKAGAVALGATSRQAIDSIATGFTRGIVVGAGAAAGAVFKLTSEADRIKNVAASLGVTTDALQEMEFAAAKSGLTTEQLQNGMRQLSANLRLVGTSGGKGEAAGALKQLGLDAKELSLLRPDQQLRKIADAAKAYGASAQRNAALARLFGEESGAKFAELLNDGSDGLDKLAKKAREYGVVMDREMLERADAVAESFTDFRAILRGVVLTIGNELLPETGKAIGAASKWLLANRKLIATNVREWIDKIRQALKSLAPAGRVFAEWAGKALDILRTMQPETVALAAKIGLVSVAASKATPLVSGLGTAISATFGTLLKVNPTLLTNPYTAILTALLALIPVAYEAGNALGDVLGVDPDEIRSRRRATSQTRALENTSAVGFKGNIEGMTAGSLRQIRDRLKTRSERLLTGKDVTLRQLSTGQYVPDRAASKAEIDVIDKKLAILDRELKVAEIKEAALAEEKRLEAENLAQFKKDQKKLEAQEERRRLRKEYARLAGLSGQGPKAVTDEELAKLIAEASKTGQNLDQLLKGRKIAGGAPPVITVQVTTFNTDIGGIDVVVPQGTPVGEVVSLTAQSIEPAMNEVLRKHSRTGPRAIV